MKLQLDIVRPNGAHAPFEFVLIPPSTVTLDLFQGGTTSIHISRPGMPGETIDVGAEETVELKLSRL